MSVRMTLEGGVAVVELDNPERRNAIDVQTAAELVEACDSVDHDPRVGAVVLRGAGGFFCSGGDRRVLARSCQEPLEQKNFDDISSLYQSFTRVGQLTVPTVAAVRGGAVGAGLNLAMAADVLVVATDATLTPGFLDIGLHPGGGHMHLLSSFGGPQTAAAVGMLGASIDGARAAQLGIAWEAVADADVETRAMELVQVISRDPDLARHAKRSLMLQTRSPGVTWAAAVQVERVAQLWSFSRSASQQS